jgi:translocator protein
MMMSSRLRLLLLLLGTLSLPHCATSVRILINGRKAIEGLLGSRKVAVQVPKVLVVPRVKNAEIAFKTGLLASSVEAAVLVSILQGSLQITTTTATSNKWNPIIWQLPLARWIAILAVVFGSAGVRSALDGTVKAAAQTLRPTVTPGDPEWYANLRKPWFNPPGWLFPIMWLVVSKPTQVLALRSLLVSLSDGANGGWKRFIPYGIHLALGDTWNQIFFNHQRIGLGAMVISLFWSALLVTIYVFDDINPWAGYFLLPTAAWVTVAALLNLEIYRLNPYSPPPPPSSPPPVPPRRKLWR